MPQPSNQGLKKIKQALQEASFEREWTKYDRRWLVEASKLVDSGGKWTSDGPFANGCSEPTWKRFVDGKTIKSYTFQVFCSVLGLDWREIAAQEPHSNLELRIGLSSESREVIANLLEDFGRIFNAFLPESYPRVNFIITKLNNETAKTEFRKRGVYDIIMLDDPWIPSYLDSIEPLSQELIGSYLTEHNVNITTIFGQLFHQSFRSICVHEDQIVGLPILGNVQLLTHRCDVENRLASQIKHSSFNQDLPYLSLEFIENFYSIIESTGFDRKDSYSVAQSREFVPLVIRNDNDNDKVEVFWQILRALGYEDKVEHDAVVIDLNKAKQARYWLANFTHRMSFLEIQSALLAKSSNISLALGWPGWLSVALNQNSLALREIKFQRFTKHPPIMGAWCLALPRHSAQPKMREYAVRVIFALTANPDIQFFLAKRGNIPVLSNFSMRIDELKQIPFWRENYNTIYAALAASLPRPRTKYWNDIEKELNIQIHHKEEFETIPERLVFSDSL